MCQADAISSEYRFLTRNVFPCLVSPTGGCRNPGIRTRVLVPTKKVEEREEEERAPPPLRFRPSCSSASAALTVLLFDDHSSHQDRRSETAKKEGQGVSTRHPPLNTRRRRNAHAPQGLTQQWAEPTEMQSREAKRANERRKTRSKTQSNEARRNKD